MARETLTTPWQRALLAMSGTFVLVIVLVALYWGRAIFIPLALAVFLTFVLSPLTTLLQRRVGHLGSIALVVLGTILVLALVGWVVVQQAMSLLDEIPRHTEEIKAKIEAIRRLVEGGDGGRLARMMDELSAHFQASPGNPEAPRPPEPARVVVKPAQPAWLGWLGSLVGQLVEGLAQAGLAVVLFVFMLAKRSDLRNRLIRLAGLDRMTITTRAVDDAAQRLSRFLYTQAAINAAYGACITVGLFALGVPHAILWGFLSGVLRYVPYLGAPLAALFPITLSLVTSSGWTQPLLIVALVAGLEMLFGNLIEPWQFGQSIGVSEVAQLTAAAFWAFLWGPIGLVLSGPLTVCLVVLGKYAPQLEFLEVLLGDEPPLTPPDNYYQRLMAHDQDEAAEIVQERLGKESAETVFDEILIPALCHARLDRNRGELSDEDESFIVTATREILEDAVEDQEQPGDARQAGPPGRSGGTPERASSGARVRLLLCPARDAVDQAALEMFQQLLKAEKWDIHLVDPTVLAAELLDRVNDFQPTVVCIGSLPPGSLAHTRDLCKRLRNRFPDLHILVGRWGQKQRLEDDRQTLHQAGADHVEATLQASRQQLRAWFSVLVHEQEPALAGK